LIRLNPEATAAREAFLTVTWICILLLHANADSTPIHPPGLEKVGDWAITTIIDISARLKGTLAQDTGSAIVYANGVSGVSYEFVPTLHASRIGDRVKLCLVSILTNCPMSEDRGHEYQATNLRTGKHWASGYSSDYIRQIAPNYGVDASAAIAIFEKETGGNSDFIGDMGSSFGPFQLHYGGMLPDFPRLNNSGLGDEFTAATGLDASDPGTWKAQVDFSLYKASAKGWTPWSSMSAAGLSKWSGIDQSQNGRDASQRYYQNSSPRRDLASSYANQQNPNSSVAAAMPSSVQPTFPALPRHPLACEAGQH
jgi:hypothetical protein